MTDIFISVLNMSAAASIVAVAVIIARLPLTKAPKIFSYALWAVVFLRLVCPINFESPASLMPTNAEIIPHSVIYEPVPHIESGVSIVDIPLNQLIENSFPVANPTASVNPVHVVLSIAAYVWFLGIAALLSYAVVGYIRLKRRVYDATIENGNVYRTDKIATAFVLGLVRPKIYIPLSISGLQLEHILRHEQVHIRRRDYLIKPLAFIILAVHWFNPVVWISSYLMAKDMEMSCDEAVLRGSENDLRQIYSVSLVNLYTRKPAMLSPLAFGEGSYNNMKARIKNVLNFKKTPKWAIAACSFLMVLFVVGFATNPMKILSADNIADSPVNNNENDEPDDVLEVTPSPVASVSNNAPLIVNKSWVDFDDGDYKWPMNASYVTNTGNKNIINYEQIFLAFDKDGNPLELYWDARNVAANGEVGSVGFGAGGVDYGIVTDIYPISPKSYSHMNNQDRDVNNLEKSLDSLEEMLNFIDKEESAELEKRRNELINEVIIEPGETKLSDYANLFDGWDQPAGTHKAAYIISSVKSVTFEDGTVWNNPEYADWISKYEGNAIAVTALENYYQTTGAN